MPDIHALRARTLRRYQLMFRLAVACLLAGAVLVPAGIAHAAAGNEPLLASVGVLLASLSALSAYKFVLSTAALLDAGPA
jgi:hypothetical protein